MKSLRTVFINLLCASAIGISHAAPAEPCCGPITAAGQTLLQTLDASNVENLWLAHVHVNWETGEADGNGDGHDTATHCSAFAAAMGEKLGVYMLRPPEHRQTLLANAQAAWFASQDGIDRGWHVVATAQEAQAMANTGKLVVVVYQSPNPKKPGHIAIIRPSLKSSTLLEQEGPEIIQAGTHNHLDWNTRAGFKGHPGAWPDGVGYFVHDLASTTTPAG